MLCLSGTIWFSPSLLQNVMNVYIDLVQILQEEYKEGEEMGVLECGHDFHSQCIKEWLKRKNLCPICKTTGLNTVEKSSK